MTKATFPNNRTNTMSYSIPISLLRQYCFCPRIPYFQELLKLNPPRPEWVKQGEILHQKQATIFKHRTLKRFSLESAQQQFEVFVQSDYFHLHGIIDSTLTTDSHLYPIEIKLSGNKPTKGQIMQLTAYAMVAKQQFDLVCNKGFILFGQKGKTFPINIDYSMEKKVMKISQNILNDLEKSCLPDSSATATQCTQCEYLNHCNDRN